MIERLKSLFARRRGPDAQADAGEPVRKVNPYHAVSIVPGGQGCGGHGELRKRRFLAREAPRLPLQGCTDPACRCRYQHHGDRRELLRRMSDLGATAGIMTNRDSERRDGGGRRSDE